MTLLQVWVAAPYHFTCPTLSHEMAQRLEADGWQLVWDSAPDDFKAAQVAAQQHGAPVPFCSVKIEPERREEHLREILGLYDFMKWETHGKASRHGSDDSRPHRGIGRGRDGCGDDGCHAAD